MNSSKREFLYRVTIPSSSWSPSMNKWLKTVVGNGNFMYVSPQDAFKYLRYGFRKEEDALAFKLKYYHGRND